MRDICKWKCPGLRMGGMRLQLLLIGIMVLMLPLVAFAVTGDFTQPLFGAYPELLNFLLPLIVPFLVSFFSRLNWPNEAKRLLLGVICFIPTFIIGWLGGNIVRTDLAFVNIVATWFIVFGVSNLLYMALAKKVFAPLAELTEPKKN